MSIMRRLRQETQKDHKKLEAFPYFNALMEHKLPLECYINQLRGLAVIHGVLESELAAIADERITAVWKDDLRKLPLLEEDLRFFAPRVKGDYKPAIDACLAMTEQIRLRRMESPTTLLGYLYVFEGITLGNRMHQPDITATFHLAGLTGCRYYTSYGERVPDKWQLFTERMDAALADPILHDSVLDAAHEAFAGLERLYKSLFPMETLKNNVHVTRINPEAGNHPIPEDEREINAALAASDLAWAEFPYYQARYGNRGKRFSDSDMCWLVTLTNLDPKSMESQINWLCRVLATRGMPSILLEKTLKVLVEELVKTVPEKKSTYEKLHRVAETLFKKRIMQIPEQKFIALDLEFNQMAGAREAEHYRNIGILLTAAVADEKSGMTGVIAPLREWLTDASRFPKEWIAAVEIVLKKAEGRDLS